MVKTVILLPDGRKISSGTPGQPAVQSCVCTQCVNAGTELTPGSVCAAMAELKIIVPDGSVTVQAGDRLEIWKEDGTDSRKLGVFFAEKPQWVNARLLKVTAYDAVSLLDRDVSDWLQKLTDWPATLGALAALVCNHCGVALAGEDFPEADFPATKPAGTGITGRKLMQWIGQAAGCFCRANADGALEFSRYAPAPVVIAPAQTQSFWEYADGVLRLEDPAVTATEENGALHLQANHWTVTEGQALEISDTADRLFYFQGSFSCAEYAVAPVEKVVIAQSKDDVGAIWPDDPEATNACRIQENPLLAARDKTLLQALAQRLLAYFKTVTYTPCQVTVPATGQLRAGQIVTLLTPAGQPLQVYVMTSKLSGQTQMLECTGSARRDSVSAVNEQSYTQLQGKVLNLRTDVDGLYLENRQAAQRSAALELTVEGITARVEQQWAAEQAMQQQLTAVQQTARQVALTVQSLQTEGSARVQTQTGYTFDEQGLRIARSGQQMENLLDNTGMYVKRGDQVILKASSDGVTAVDVQVGNYLTVGHARLESYETGRTACFYIGG